MNSTRFYRFAGVGCIIVVMLTVATDPQFLSPGALLIAALGVALTPLGMNHPLWAAAAYSVLFAICGWHPEWRSLLLLAWSAVIVGLISYRRPWTHAVIPGLVLVLLSIVDPTQGVLASLDLFSFLLVAAFNVAGIIVGVSLKKARQRQQAAEQRSQEYRHALMTTLHDSVATTLTSVVMRSETLGLMGTDPKLKENSAAIADDARKAMGEVRDLLRLMKNEDQPLLKKARSTAAEELEEMQSFLHSHGFDCTVEGRRGKLARTMALPNDLHLVFSELCANLIKYTAADSQIAIVFKRNHRGIDIQIRSVIAKAQADQHITTGLGISEIQKRVAAANGTFSSGPKNGMWISTLYIPLSSMVRR